jgi:cytoskeletal protein CcmA (bactofilin family)
VKGRLHVKGDLEVRGQVKVVGNGELIVDGRQKSRHDCHQSHVISGPGA